MGVDGKANINPLKLITMIIKTEIEELQKFYKPLTVCDIKEAFPNNDVNPKYTVKSWSPCCIHEFKTHEDNPNVKNCIKCGERFNKTHLVLIPFNEVHKDIYNG